MSHRTCSCLTLDADAGPVCATCRFSGCSYPQAIECHRHAPEPGADRGGFVAAARWPLVGRHDWCGDYEPRP